jgi:exosome complex component MTR3
LGLTKVICAVYGPREVTRREDFSLQGQLLCVFKFATFSGRYRRQHQPDSEEKELSQIMREALEPAVILDKFPKARMDIFVTVLEDDGSALSAGLSAASLALAHAGVEMFDLVVGASLRHVEGVTLVNPSATEERYIPESKESTTDDSSLTIGYMPSLRQVSALVQGGLVDLVTNEKYINTCIEMCVRMYPVLQKCLADSLASKETKTNNAL